jgi:hypothetical protein
VAFSSLKYLILFLSAFGAELADKQNRAAHCVDNNFDEQEILNDDQNAYLRRAGKESQKAREAAR